MFTTLGPPIQGVRISPYTPSKFQPKTHIFSWQGMCKLWAADNSKWVKWLEKGYQITWIYKDLKRTEISTHTECVINIPLAGENCTYCYLTHIERGIANLA